MTRARRADVTCWCTSRHQGTQRLPYSALTTRSARWPGPEVATAAVDTLRHLWMRLWRVFRTTRFTAQVDPYQPCFHSLAFLSVVGAFIFLVHSVSNRLETTRNSFSTVPHSALSFHSFTHSVWDFLPVETTFVILCSTLTHLA